ncbi:ABC protein [Sistotremastrum niveocremeum HHB9708]|uniref:ABC protein n=1 Tax=Sistotremastrum niveocremeum HHB9708 TaxID=1314777 RepID=A0A164W1S2_9AGAM|nr:ABC protein [Sistotremastrum niveocremeum HHB9708]
MNALGKSKSQSSDPDVDEKLPGGFELAKDSTVKPEAQQASKLDQKLFGREVQLDEGDAKPRFKEHWWQIWRPKDPPPPPPKTLAEATLIPLATASIFSMLTYTWITPMMVLGYQRILQAPDLWKLDPSREAGPLSQKLDNAWARRFNEAKEWNARLDKGEIQPGRWTRMKWSTVALYKGKTWKEERYKRWRTDDGRKVPSLAWALNETFGWHFWLGGVFKVFGDTAQLMGPLLAKAIIRFSQNRLTAKAEGREMPSIGRGVAMAIGLFLITITASVCQHQFFWRSMATGVLGRAALIGSIYRRGVNLTPKARVKFPNAALVNHISTDVSRVDACAQWFHAFWTAPIQITICLIILLVQLGPSALAGFSLFIIVIPFQERAMSYQFHVRQKSMKWTDQRAKLILELLGGMRIIKYFSYEMPFLKRIYSIRGSELLGIRKILIARAANLAIAFTIPVLAAVIAFITYTLSGHGFDSAIIFSSLSLFNLLRQPLLFLPRALSAISDAQSAMQRLSILYSAETRTDDAFEVDPSIDEGLLVKNACFTWEESTAELKAKDGKKGKNKGAKAKKPQDEKPEILSTAPFVIRDMNLSIPRGQLCAIVGPVGSGKSSLLQGLIGEMRTTSGSVKFGGSVAYCAQTAWIQNASLRDNVVFGREWDEERYWRVIEDASLLPDLELLPDGDLTEIGEKGINLSGGQKQRVNIARALYFDADIVLMDDPLSAVDAHVGKALFNDAILNGLKARGKTVILVTHALHFLPQVDQIYTLVDGTIAEQGSYSTLIKHDGPFARLMVEFGGGSAEEEEEDKKMRPQADLSAVKEKSSRLNAVGTGKLEGRLMKAEKRTTGAVSWSIYSTYIKAGKGWITMPLIIITALLMQVMNTYTLVWWEANTFNKPVGFWMALYGGLGVLQALFTFLLGAAMGVLSYLASGNLHHESVRRVFHAPMSFFDTTPLGRILSVFGKDIDTIDSTLSVVLVLSNVFGAVAIVTALEHYFLIAAAGIALGYNYFAAFYRNSAREMKRLDASLRSLLYSHFSESLSGLATIRAYGEVPRFLRDNEYYTDLEDRALFLTITNQRWLAIRLDFLGGILVVIIAMFVVTGVSGISPAQIGLVLTYTTSLTQMFGMVTRQSAELENNMNSVERVVQYSRGDLIEQEPDHDIDDKKPPPSWPDKGTIEFDDVVMRYRPGLPPVLKGISLSISEGEKIGVVGRTGAGKSSLMVALFRIVELASGRISIDGIDISTLGLRDLRTKLAIIPQDPLLFSGTIRSNLDPFSQHDDATLWSALRRSYLVSEQQTSGDATPIQPADRQPANRFTLDTIIDQEGSNLSVGERSLLSLARALVKDSKVIVLDEATASVDLETDSKIQYTIQTEFRSKTLLCIAHRLRTILSYDRILVLDAGQIAEFDTPLNLFAKDEGIFRGMCERSNITRDDIEKSTARIG